MQVILDDGRTLPRARRSWLFVEGANEEALASAPRSQADVLIQELEDFTPPHLRSIARRIAPDVLAAWKAAGVIAAVRVNPLERDGMTDLEAVMRGAPHAVLLPKSSTAAQIERLDRAISELEAKYRMPLGSTEIIPNVELARGLVNTAAICRASERVTGSLVASEDTATDLGAERGRDGIELDYVRARFHLECTAVGMPSIDCPYTWTDIDGLEADTMKARRLGYRAKAAVHDTHPEFINALLTPSPEAIANAQRTVQAFELAQSSGDARAELDGSLIEVPIYLNAKRLLERADELRSAT